VPVVVTILLQSRILQDQAKPKDRGVPVGREVLLSRTMLMFFGFFLLSSMATSGIQAFLIATLDSLWATPLAVASLALTGYVAGATGGVLIGGWYADRYSRHFTFVAALTAVSITLFLAMGLVPLPDALLPIVALAAGTALGASRTPRDVMVKNAAPPGQMGKVFGFISSGLPLGGAITPVPFGLMLDHGMAWLVLPTVALLLLGSLLCAGSARGEALRAKGRAAPSTVAAE
jgi:MFS family permease